jgi:hypothetical protein
VILSLEGRHHRKKCEAGFLDELSLFRDAVNPISNLASTDAKL